MIFHFDPLDKLINNFSCRALGEFSDHIKKLNRIMKNTLIIDIMNKIKAGLETSFTISFFMILSDFHFKNKPYTMHITPVLINSELINRSFSNSNVFNIGA